MNQHKNTFRLTALLTVVAIILGIYVFRLQNVQIAQAKAAKNVRTDTYTYYTRVTAAREIQRARWKPFGFSYNSEIPEKFLRRNASMKPEVRDFILETLKRVKLSGRGLSRVLRVARTIADLEVAPRIEVRHVAEAAGYREGEATSWMNG